MLYLRGQRRTAAVSSDASVVCTRVCRSAMTRIAEDHGMWPSASTRTTWDPARRSRTASGVTPAACRSMNTRAPCGIESIRNEPTNNSFCVSVAVGLFLTSGETTGSFTTTRIARSAIGEVSGAAGATGIGAGGIATGSGRGVNGSARGCSDDVSHETETRITQTSAPKAEPDANDHRPLRFFDTGGAEGVVTTGRRLGRLLGVGSGVAGLIDAGRSLENSSSGSVAHSPLRSWFTVREESIGFSDTGQQIQRNPHSRRFRTIITGFPVIQRSISDRSRHG
jgi:hypothetical protein